MAPAKDRDITVKESGKKIYEGRDRRYYSSDYKAPGFLGMGIADYIKLALYIGGVVVFLVKADQRLSSVETNQLKMVSTVERLVDWTQNSDSWNTLQYNTKFKNGQPENDRYWDYKNRAIDKRGR